MSNYQSWWMYEFLIIVGIVALGLTMLMGYCFYLAMVAG